MPGGSGLGGKVNMTLTPFKASGVYDIGEKVGWTIAGPVGDYTYTVKKNNFDTIKTGKFDLSAGSATIEVTLDEPAMVYAQVSSAGGEAIPPVGAAVAPDQLQPSVACPADFDSFWASKIQLLEAIPENAVLTPSD